MIVIKTIAKIRKLISKNKSKIIGFVPTMGALHDGHLSLIRKARKECDYLVVSIFVNPLQFSEGEDYQTYPKDFINDKKNLGLLEVDLLFFAQSNEMYKEDFSTYVYEEILSKGLCGCMRPEHFKGVCTILAKFFNIVDPNVAYFGQKDYQQVMIVKKMVQDLNFKVKIKVLPIVREKDGLAMSSRNKYLNPSQRAKSLCLYEALSLAKSLIKIGETNAARVLDKMSKQIAETPLAKVEYIKILNADNLGELNIIKGRIVIVLAVYIGKTRLIDNVVLNVNR